MSTPPGVPSPQPLPRPAPSVSAARREGRTILMDLDGGRYYALEGVGGAVWEALAGGDTLEGVTARLAERYGKEAAEVRPEVEAFIRRLHALGVVQ